MVDNANVDEANTWNDPVQQDTLLSPVTKVMFWSGYAVTALSLITMSFLLVGGSAFTGLLLSNQFY